MIKRSIRLLVLASSVTAASSVPSNPFVGDWKLNPSKSTITDKMKVESVGDNKYAFDFGGGRETIAIDGTDQPTNVYGAGTLSVGIDGDGWKVVRKANGRALITAIWRLSKDSSSLTDHFSSFNADGSPYTLNYVYARRAAGSGFAGTWVSTSLDAVNYIITMRIRPFEDMGLAIVDSASQFTGNVSFAASAVRRLSEHAVALMRKKGNGPFTDFLRLELSPDSRTLTVTPYSSTADEPRIYVFDRQ